MDWYHNQSLSRAKPQRTRRSDMVIRDTIKPVPEIEDIWVREAEVRWDAFARGQVKPISYADVMARYQKK